MGMAYVSPSANNMQQANQFRRKKKKKKRLNLFLFPRIKVNIQLQHYTFQIPSWDQNEKRQASYDLTVEKFPGQTVKQEVWIQI